jgi:hypothetical protein
VTTDSHTYRPGSGFPVGGEPRGQRVPFDGRLPAGEHAEPVGMRTLPYAAERPFGPPGANRLVTGRHLPYAISGKV